MVKKFDPGLAIMCTVLLIVLLGVGLLTSYSFGLVEKEQKQQNLLYCHHENITYSKVGKHYNCCEYKEIYEIKEGKWVYSGNEVCVRGD